MKIYLGEYPAILTEHLVNIHVLRLTGDKNLNNDQLGNALMIQQILTTDINKKCDSS